MADPTTLRCAFDLGRAENEFRWSVVNVILGGVDGTTSLSALNRVCGSLEVLTVGRQSSFRVQFDEFQGDWRDYLAMEAAWSQRYADALEVFTEEGHPGLSPSERILHFVPSFLNQYRHGLEQISQAALLFAGESVKATYALGLVLDQGIRPAIADVETEVAPELGYDAPRPMVRVPTLSQFIREVQNPDHIAWRKRRTDWHKRHGTNRAFDEAEPPHTTPAPCPHQPGELPPSTSWCLGLRALWERAGLDRRRPLPESTANMLAAVPATRVALVEHIVNLAYEAFNEMRSVSAGPGLPQPEPQTQLELLVREFAAKLTECTPAQRVAYYQYTFACRAFAASGSTSQPTDAEVHSWLRNDEDDSPLGEVPAEFETWARYLRGARKKTGELKNRPRSGRTGRSIIRPEGDESTQPEEDTD